MRRLVLSGCLVAGAMFATPAAAQTAEMPGLDQTVAYIRERCDGATVRVPGPGVLRYTWSLRDGTTMDTLEYDEQNIAAVRAVPVNAVTFSASGDNGAIAADCSDSMLIDQCPVVNGRRARYVSFYCRERDKVINALNHLQRLLGGPAPASDPFA